MSRFHTALDFVLSELDRRRESGYGDWRAAAGAVQRLGAARPLGVVPVPAAMVAPVPPGPEPAEKISATTPMPPSDDSDALPLFGDEDDALAAATPRSKSKKVLPVTTPGAYESVTDPALPKAERLGQLRACPQRIPCAECPYGSEPHNHIVFGNGNTDAELMFIGEAPGADEDAKGEPFVGKAGQLLNKIIGVMGYKREEIYVANILKCRPDTPGQSFGNRPPRPEEMQSCRPTLFEQIDIIRPKAIVALGATAMKGLLDNDAPMRDLRGRWHDFHGIPVMATYHPSYLLRNQAPTEKRKVWEDMLLVKERLGHDITEKDRSYFLTKG